MSGDLPWEKPDQHIFLEACKLLNVEPRHCIMVGDKLETDIKVWYMNNLFKDIQYSNFQYTQRHSKALKQENGT